MVGQRERRKGSTTTFHRYKKQGRTRETVETLKNLHGGSVSLGQSKKRARRA